MDVPNIKAAAVKAGLSCVIESVRMGYFKSKYVVIVTGEVRAVHRFLAQV